MKIGDVVKIRVGGGEGAITYIGRYGVTVQLAPGYERSLRFDQVDWFSTVERLSLTVEGLEAEVKALTDECLRLTGQLSERIWEARRLREMLAAVMKAGPEALRAWNPTGMTTVPTEGCAQLVERAQDKALEAAGTSRSRLDNHTPDVTGSTHE